METFNRILAASVRDNVSIIRWVSEYESGIANIYPAWEIIDISEEKINSNSLGTSQRYNTEVLADSRLTFLDPKRQFDTKYTNRNDTFNTLLVTLLTIPSFLNVSTINVHYKGAVRSSRVEEDGLIKIIYDISVGYTLRQNWDEGLDISELFSRIDKLKAPINKL